MEWEDLGSCSCSVVGLTVHATYILINPGHICQTAADMILYILSNQIYISLPDVQYDNKNTSLMSLNNYGKQ